MTLITGNSQHPNFICLSTDADNVTFTDPVHRGKSVFFTDTLSWKIIAADGVLQNFAPPDASNGSDYSAFGTLETNELEPVVQLDFVYGINSQTGISTTSNGTVDTDGSRLRLQTTTNAAGSAIFRSRKIVRYRPGQGIVARFTAAFTTGKANSTQIAGVGVTTKGDLQGFTTVAARVPVGSNDQILTADNTQAAGLKWAAPASQVSVTTKGDLQTFSTVKDRLAVGTNGFILTADSTAATGVKWVKRTPLVSSAASASTLTPDAAAYDEYCFTALAAALTINAPTNVYDGAKLVIRLKDNATARGLTWNAVFRAVGVTLPTTTVISKVLYVGFIYNAAETKWDCVAVAQEA